MVTKLEKFAGKQCCVICKESHTDELIYGAVYKLGQITVHYFCLLLSTDMAQRGKDSQGILGFLPRDIQSVVKKSAAVSCTLCQRGGATIRCSKCRAVFHLPCGIRHRSSHQFYGQFKSFCPHHRIQQNIPRDVLVGMQSMTCSICLENAELENLIWAPCCKKNGFFHRRCLQRMAYSFGSYTLKCPLCNNRKKFIQAVEYHGIYIPQQDASWEVEPNAFIELLERYEHCDAEECVCPKGRKYNKNSTSSANWKILLCMDCGSQGVHYKCLSAGSCFKCDLCKHVESQKKSETRSLSSHINTRQASAASVNGDHRISDNITNTTDLNFEMRLQNLSNSANFNIRSEGEMCVSSNHSNITGSFNGELQHSENITNTTDLDIEMRQKNSSNTRSEVEMCASSIHSNFAGVFGYHKEPETITSTTDSNVEMDVDKNHQNSINSSNTTSQVEICVNELNQDSNKSTIGTKIHNSPVFIAVEKRNSTADCISIEDKMDIDSENNNFIHGYQSPSSYKRHANGESIPKETSSACESTTADQSEEEQLVKRRRIEKIATASESASSNPVEIQSLGNCQTLLKAGRNSSEFDNQHTHQLQQLNVALEGFEGSSRKKMVVFADDHGKHLEFQLKRTQKFAVSVEICEGRAEECLNYVEKNLNQVDVSVIICGSHDIAKKEAEKYLSALERLVSRNRKYKFVIVDLPVRYDRPHWSHINNNIRKTNEKLRKLFQDCKNVSMVYVSEAGRKKHTIYGRHLDYYGKIWLTNRICWAANLLVN